ncbi:MAG: hypothetical protein AAF288_13055 [Planctomycetota bacterium]
MAIFALTACDGGADTPEARGPGGVAPDRPAPEQVVTMRGRVMQVPAAGDGTDEFFVHHEESPDWPNPDGGRGMMEMTMGFTPERGVSLETIEAGDAVEMQVAVRWANPSYMVVTEITELPIDTQFQIRGEAISTTHTADTPSTAPGTAPASQPGHHDHHDHGAHHGTHHGHHH